MAKFRVRDGACYHGHGAGSEIEVDEHEAAIIPWCLEATAAAADARPTQEPMADEKPASLPKSKKAKS